MSSLPPYHSPNPDGATDLAQRLGGMSMDQSAGSTPPPHHPSAISPIPSSLEAAMNVPLPPGSSLASHHSFPLPPPLSPLSGAPLADYPPPNNGYGYYSGQQQSTMPMAPGMEPPFSPVLAPGGYGFGAMQGMAMQEVPLVPDQQAQFEYGHQAFTYGLGEMQHQSARQAAFPGFLSNQLPQGPDQGFNAAQGDGRFGNANKGRGGGAAGRWSRQTGSLDQGFAFNNRFQQPLKSPGRGSYRPPQQRRSQDASYNPGANRVSGQEGVRGLQGAWASPPSLVSDRTANGTPNSSYPVTPRSRSGSSFNGVNANGYRSPMAMSVNQYSPQNPYAQHEYYNQVAPGGYGFAAYGNAPKQRPWKRFDDQPKSIVLEEFRSGRSNRAWTLKDIAGSIIEFSGDQSGSRLVQERIEQATAEERQAIFEEVRPNALTLMTDVYGNYVIQKFFEHGSKEQKSFLVDQMFGRVLTLSNQMYGCRVVQTALDHVENDMRLKLINELKGKYLECVKQANANHVIQRIVLNDPPQHVLNSFIGHVEDLALHTFGCRVLQKALETLSEKQLRPLLDELHKSVQILIEDAFGNYVIQSIITSGPAQDRDKVVKVIKNKVFAYSRHKFASNVVEKAVRFARPEDRTELVYSLVFYKSEGFHRVPMLLKDSYANFVFQTCLLHAERQQRQQLLDLLVPLLPTLMHTPVGKRIAAIVENMSAEGFHLAPSRAPSGRFDRDRVPAPIDVSSGRASPTGSDATEKTEVDTLRGHAISGRSSNGSESTTTISSPTPRHAEPHVNVGLGIAMNGALPGRELRPIASAPPGTDRIDRERAKGDWRQRSYASPLYKVSAPGPASTTSSRNGSPVPVPAQQPMMVPSSVGSRSLKGTVSMLDVQK